MPQAAQYLHDAMQEYFGEEYSDREPHDFLMSCGWLHDKGMYTEDKSYEDISQKEWHCLDYLCDEWDCDYRPGTKP